MSAHAQHAMHPHSVQAYREERPALQAREREVLEVVRTFGPMTDREVMECCGYREPNAVRPRITGLIDAGLLVEHDRVRCPVTGKTVRRAAVRMPGEQMAMLL